MKALHTLLAITILVLACLSADVSAAEGVTPADLRCEYLVNPLGIDEIKPRLNWHLKSGQRGHKQLVEFLLKNGADANLMTQWLPRANWTFFIGEEDSGRGVTLLIQNRPTSNTPTGPIPRALANQLVFKGPDGKTGKWPISPLWVAKRTGNAEIGELLQEYGAFDLSLHQAAAKGNIGQVQLHISQGNDVNAVDAMDKLKRTPLMYASYNGHTEIVDLLRKHGAKE